MSSRYSLRLGPVSITHTGLGSEELEGLQGVARGKLGVADQTQWLYRPGRAVDERFSLDVSFTPRPEEPWVTSPMWLDYERSTGSYRSTRAFWETELFATEAPGSGRATVSMGPHPREEGSYGWRISLRESAGALLSAIAPHADALMLHGCGLVHPEDGQARLFLGRSRAGKSTMNLRLDDWELLGDDKVLVWLDGDELLACGTPFMSKNLFVGWGETHRVHSMYALEPGASELRMESIGPAEAFRTLLECIFLPYGEGPLAERAMEVATGVLERVSWGRLASSLEHDLSGQFQAVSS